MQKRSLTTGPIPALIWKVAAPTSIGYFFHTMFNVTDTWFAGRISTETMAALSLSFPVFIIIIAIGSGIGTGTTALVGDSLGGEDSSAASDYAAQALSFGIFISVLLTAAGLWASPYLFRFLGASREYLAISLAYMNVIFCGSVFFMMAFIFNGVLFALGDATPNRNFLVVAFIANVVLDPWFIFGGFGLPAMGISGIGLATILCEAAGAIYLGIRVFRSGIIKCPRLVCFLPKSRVIADLVRQGLPAAFSMATVGAGVFIITYFVSMFGKESVAAYGIGVRVEQLVLLPAMGLNTSTLALVAQNSGAKFSDRVKDAVRLAISYGGRMMIPMGVVVFFASKWLMSIFSDDPRVIEAGASYLKVDAFVFWAYVILYVNVAALQGMKRPMFAVWIGILRQFVLPVIVFQIFVVILGVGLTGIWWGIFGITWSAALFAYFYAGRVLKTSFTRAEPQRTT
jgi:putative MATE family efflux protein